MRANTPSDCPCPFGVPRRYSDPDCDLTNVEGAAPLGLMSGDVEMNSPSGMLGLPRTLPTTHPFSRTCHSSMMVLVAVDDNGVVDDRRVAKCTLWNALLLATRAATTAKMSLAENPMVEITIAKYLK